jgi:hypothetical protein
MTLLWLLILAVAELMSLAPDPSPCLMDIEGYRGSGLQQSYSGCAPLHVVAIWMLDALFGWFAKNNAAINALATIVIAFFTVTLAWSTHRLWQASKDQINVARDEFYSTHRPKIRIKHLWLQSDIWHGERIAVTLTCVNIGTVDATLAEVGIRYEIVRNDLSLPPKPHIDAVYNFAGARLPCGRNFVIDRLANGPTLTAEEAADIQQERSQLYCIGYVSYLDNAGRMRITGCCRVLTFPAGRLAHTGNARFRVFHDPDFEYED